VKTGGKQNRAPLLLCFLLGLFFDPEDGGDMFPKRRLTFNGLHGVISQKIVLFITTAVRTSNPTKSILCFSAEDQHSSCFYAYFLNKSWKIGVQNGMWVQNEETHVGLNVLPLKFL
jgi:hypothetical protein